MKKISDNNNPRAAEETKNLIKKLFDTIIIRSIMDEQGNIDSEKLQSMVFYYYQTDAKLQYETEQNIQSALDEFFSANAEIADQLSAFNGYLNTRFQKLNSFKDMLFMHAVIINDIDSIKQYLKEEEIDPTTIKDNEDQGILFLAVWLGNEEMLKILLDSDKYTPEKLVEQDSKYQHTVLHLCVIVALNQPNVNASLIQLLIDKRIDLNCLADAHDETAIFAAVKLAANQGANLLIIFKLWWHGADLNIANTYSITPLGFVDEQYEKYKKEVKENSGRDIQQQYIDITILKGMLDFLVSVKEKSEREELNDMLNSDQIGIVHFFMQRYPAFFTYFIMKIDNYYSLIYGKNINLNLRHAALDYLSPIELAAKNSYLTIVAFLLVTIGYANKIGYLNVEALIKYAEQGMKSDQQKQILEFLATIAPSPQNSKFDPASLGKLKADTIYAELITQINDGYGYAIYECLRAYYKTGHSFKEFEQDQGPLIHHFINASKRSYNSEEKIIILLQLLLSTDADINALQDNMTALDRLKYNGNKPKLIAFFEDMGGASAKDHRIQLVCNYVVNALHVLDDTYKSIVAFKKDAQSSYSPEMTASGNKLRSPKLEPKLLEDVINQLKNGTTQDFSAILENIINKIQNVLVQYFKHYGKKFEELLLFQNKLSTILKNAKDGVESGTIPAVPKPSETVMKQFGVNEKDEENKEEDKQQDAHVKTPGTPSVFRKFFPGK